MSDKKPPSIPPRQSGKKRPASGANPTARGSSGSTPAAKGSAAPRTSGSGGSVTKAQPKTSAATSGSGATAATTAVKKTGGGAQGATPGGAKGGKAAGATPAPAAAAPAAPVTPTAPKAAAAPATVATSEVSAAPVAGTVPVTVPPAEKAARPAKSSPTKTEDGPRRVRLSLSRIDPWSVMKLSFLISFALGIMLVVAVWVLWATLDSMEVFAKIDNLVAEILADSSLDLMQYVEAPRVLSVAALIAIVDIFLITAMSTIGAFLYNITAALVGGVHLTMTDD